MRLEPPSWWQADPPSRVARALEPLSRLVDDAAARRWAKATPFRASMPVICIGNLTVGGAGKTPLAIAVAGLLRAAGRKPGFLTRGYGGRLRGPHTADARRDSARDIGDEALLLAALAPTIVSRDRAAGARAFASFNLPADVIVMDDGLQNPQLAKQLTIAVLDPKRFIGNGLVMPAGPLRENLAVQLRRTDALVLLDGQDNAAPPLPPALASFRGQVLRAVLRPDADVAASLQGQRVVAFAGIGRPSKLFDTLRGLGAVLLAEIPFPDHHRFTGADAARLIATANAERAALVTTQKDLARMTGEARLAELRATSIALPAAAVFTGRELDRMAALLNLLLARAAGEPARLSPRLQLE